MTAGPEHGVEPVRVDGRTRRYEHRRTELVAALTEYVLDHGLADLSLRPAAAAVGVSHATLLRHFATRDDLIAEVIDTIRTDLVDRMESALPTDGSTDLPSALWHQWQRLTAPHELRQFLLLFELTARHVRALHDHDGPGAADVGMAVTRDLTTVFATNLTRSFTVPEATAETFAVMLVAQIRGLVIDIVLSNDRVPADRAMQSFIAHIATTLE